MGKEQLFRFYKWVGNKVTRCKSISEYVDACEKERQTGKSVARTTLGKVTISTSFLGMDIGFEKREIFETMVFSGERNGDRFRYSTLIEARKGHKQVVKEIKDG